jgi:adenine phosphoribosyltransferase
VSCLSSPRHDLQRSVCSLTRWLPGTAAQCHHLQYVPNLLPTPGQKKEKKCPANNLVASQLASSETLLSLRKNLSAGLKQYPDFPQPGILFEDIFPLFADVQLHRDLIQAFVLTVQQNLSSQPDIIIGLDARGFLIGPPLALALHAGFVPVRKPGKLPGKLETVEYKKEYGTDSFAIQRESVKPGSQVLIVDDLIATGGSAAAAEALVEKCGGETLGHVFLIELTKLNGRSKLKAPVFTVLESQAD